MAIEIFLDGGCRGNGQSADGKGEGACAVVIFKNRKKIAQYARPLGRTTNNAAEYEALIAGLLICSMSQEIIDPIFYSDSSLVVNQVKGIWECKNENLIPLLLSVQIIKEDYHFRLVQVPRSFVHHADTLVNSCLDRLEEERAQRIKDKEAKK